MKFFFIYAHPEPDSLSGYLLKRAKEALEAHGHEVIISDLYGMKWKAVADEDDFPQREKVTGEKLNYALESAKAFASGTQSADISAEQEKLLWADVVILQFPIWWYGMPAILKGYFDRVYAYGFAYGVGEHGRGRWGNRFGEGIMKGKKAMIAMNVGGRMAHYGPRGVNGAIDDLLFPIQHGILYYTGFSVLPPTVFYEVGKIDSETVNLLAKTYIERLLTINHTEPIPFRMQNGGDYDDVQVLKEELSEGKLGHALHQNNPVYVSNTWLGLSGDYLPRHIAPTSREKNRK